jgi:hypothetical protein
MRSLHPMFGIPIPARKQAGSGLSFSVVVTPRIRDALVLRPVGRSRPGSGRNAPDAHGLR